MAIYPVNNNLILRSPHDVLIHTMSEYLLDGRSTERLALVSRQFRNAVEEMRRGLWTELQKEPRINHFIQNSSRIEQAPSIKLKMNALSDLLNGIKRLRHPAYRGPYVPQNPGDDLRNFGALADLDEHLSLAYELRDDGLFDSISLKVVPYPEIRHTMNKAAKDGDFAKVAKLLPYLQRDSIRSALSEAIEHGHMDIVRYFFEKRSFNRNEALDSATYHNKPDVIRFILGLGDFGRGYFPMHGIAPDQLSQGAGLQYNIMRAIDENQPECLDALLEANPSLEILEHARDRAYFIKFHWIARYLTQGETIIGDTAPYWHGRDQSLDPQRDALRKAVPERFRNQWIYRNGIKPGSRGEMIEKLERAIAQKSAIVIEEVAD